MEREEPPPISSEESTSVKKDIFDDDDDDDLFKSAVEAKMGGGTDTTKQEEDTSGYMTSEVARSNTLDDIEDNELFKSALEPNSERVNGAMESFSTVPIDAMSEEKDIPLDDDNDDDHVEPQYEEEKLQDAHLQPELQLSGSTTATSAARTMTSFATESHNNSAMMMDEDELKELDSGDDFMYISVTDPNKMGEGMSSFMAYKVVTRTNSNYFKKKEMVVTRRFSDFLGLHDKLAEKYRQNGRIIPPAPDKSVVGMTKVKMTKDGDEIQDEFVERRRAALERFMNRTAAHPILKTDPDFREFLEQESQLAKSNQTSALSSRSMMKFISKVSENLSNITLKMEETDEWFEEKNHNFEQLDQQLRRLHVSTEALADYRKSLAHSTGHLSKSLAILSGSEDNSELSGAIAQLSTVHEKIEQVHHEQAHADFYYLSELIKDYIGLVGAVKDVFQERVKAWQNWQAITSSLTKKREAKVKAELAQRMDKVSILRQEIAELERQQDMAQENFDRISRQIKKEVEQFDERKANDFKKSIVKYLEDMQKAQEKIAAQWERYLPEVQQLSI